MACNWIYKDNKITGVKGNPPIFKELEEKFGLEEAIDLYTVSQSDAFQEIFGGQETVENIVGFTTFENENKNTLTKEQKADFRNMLKDIPNFNKQSFVDAFYVDGLFIITDKLQPFYSRYEIQNLKNDVKLQSKVKNAVEALKNTEEEIEATVEQVEKINEINSFGKLTNYNPQKEIQEALAGIQDRDEFDEALNNLPFPNFLRTVNRDELFEKMKEFQRVEVYSELNGQIQPQPQEFVEPLLALKKEEIDFELVDNIDFLLETRQDVLESTQEATVKILEEIVEQGANSAIDLQGLTLDKPFLEELRMFILGENPNFVEAYKTFFNKNQEVKTAVQELRSKKLKKEEKDYVQLNTTLTEEEVYNQQGLIKAQDNLWIKTAKQPLEELYPIMETYNPKIREEIQTQIAQLEGFNNAETAEAVMLYKNYFGVNDAVSALEDPKDVEVSKTDSSNPSFSDMLTFSIDGGKMEIGLIKGRSIYSILELKVDEDKRRQGRAEKLLKKALFYTKGKLSGQASNEASVALNYKLGMRAYSKEGNVELTLEETKTQRAENAGESIRMLLPLNIQPPKPINKVSNFTGNYEYLTTDFLKDFYAKMLKERNINSTTWKNFYSKFGINERGLYLNTEDLETIKDYADENLKQYSLISKQLPNLVETDVEITNRRDEAINNPQTINKFEGQIFSIPTGEIIIKDSVEEFVRVGEDVYENVDAQGNLSLYVKLPKNNSPYYKVGEKEIETDVKLSDYNYLQNKTDKFTTDLSSLEGKINNLIKSNILSDKTYEENGVKYYIPKGNSSAKKAINAQTARDILGFTRTKARKNFDISVTDNSKIAVTKTNGETVMLTPKEISETPYTAFEDGLAILALNEYKNAIPTTGKPQELEFIPENELQQKLMKLLSDLGVKTLSMVDYVTNYATKNGTPPSARALADLANQVIAFKDGVITEEDLAEETAHFIVASTPVAEKENLLRNIHKTKEWMQYAEQYSVVYNGDDALVREEILGKVLANAIKENFTQRNQNQTEDTIIARLREIFNNFFNKIASYFNSTIDTQLKSYTDSVYQNLMNENLAGNLSEINTRATLFSLDANPLYTKLSEALDLVSAQQNRLRKSASTREELKKVKELNQESDRLSKLKALKGLSLVAQKQIRTLERAVDQNKNENFPFSQEENAVFQTYVSHTSTLLSEINALLNPKVKEEKEIRKEIEETLKRGEVLKGRVSGQESVAISRLLDKIQDKHNLSETQREDLERVIRASQADTNFMQANFGTLLHARNPLLNLAGDIINRQEVQSRQAHLNATKPLTEVLDRLKIAPKRLKEFISKGGYLFNEIDNAQRETTEEQIRAEIYKELTGEDYKGSTEDLSQDDLKAFETQFRDRTEKYRENFFTEEFLTKQRDLFKDVYPVALNAHKRFRAQMSDIRAGATVNGVTIYNLDDKYEIEQINKARAEASNPRNLDGSFKKGILAEVYNEETGENDLILDLDFIQEYPEESEEGRLAYGLKQVNSILRKEFEKGELRPEGLPTLFLEELNKLQTQEEKVEFMFLNSYVGFSDDYWNNFGQNKNLLDRLRDKDAPQELIDNIRKHQQRTANILKANRVFNRPSETNVEEMSLEERNNVKDAVQDLEELYRQANAILKEEQEETVEGVFSTVANDAYRELIEDLGIDTVEDEINEIKKHTTTRGKQYIDRAIAEVNRLKKGEEPQIDMFADIFTPDMDATQLDEALLTFAQSKLLPYYKRTEPQGFTELLNQLNSGAITVEEFANSGMVKVSPNFSFYEMASNANVNQKFLENKANGRQQIKEGYFIDTNYLDYFGMKYKKEGDKTIIIDRTITKNKDMWEAYNALVTYHKDTIELLGIGEKHNLYKLPQIGKRGFRQYQDLVKDFSSRPWKEIIREMTEFRQDELEFGVDAQQNQASKKMRANIVPMYYVKDLEDQQDVTDELLMSYALMHQQAALYKARVDNLGDMLSIEQAILKQEFVGKEAQNSQTYKMFKSFMDYNSFGVKQTFSYEMDVFGRRVDLAKVANTFNNFIKKVNLTSVTIPIVSWTQGEVQRKIESVVGEVINPIASSLAVSEFKKLATPAMAEVLGINSKARLNVLGETYGTYNLSERFENSNYNKFTRGLGKSAMVTHTLMNFPIIPRVFLSVLYDNRIYNGKVYNLNQFKRLMAGEKKTVKEFELQWKSLDLLYDDIRTENGVQSYNIKNLAKKLNRTEEETESYINTYHEGLVSRVKQAVQTIDSAIPMEEKSQAARHGIANFFLTHRSWLLIAIQKRFKNKHLNLATGETEEGSYMTAYKFLRDMTVGYKKGETGSYLKHIKKIWEESDETTRRNLKRVLTDMAFVNAMMVLSFILTNMMEDDEEENWALVFADYILYRTINEQVSTQFALPSQLKDVLETPIIGIDRLSDMKDYFDVFSSDIVERGTYAGETERWRIIARNTPFVKEYDKLSNIKKTSDMYKRLNKDNFDYVWATYLLSQEK